VADRHPASDRVADPAVLALTGRRHGGFEAGVARPYPLQGNPTMRPVLLWLLGIPIPIIILLYVFHVV
jgi:hypothetical protein